MLAWTGCPETPWKAAGPTTRVAEAVMATRTSQPAWVSCETRSGTLYAAIPPETRTAMRNPRTWSGTGAGSIGMFCHLGPIPSGRAEGPPRQAGRRHTHLGTPPPLLADDLLDLLEGPLEVVVDDHVVVPVGVGHLLFGRLLALVHRQPRLAVALLAPALQLLHRGRRHEDEHPAGPL